MRAVGIIAAKEVRDGMRNKWVVATTLLLAALALTLAFLGSAPIGDVKVSPLDITVVSLSSLTIFLLPLIALLLSYDAIVGEVDRGTMALLLSYPVSRWQIVFGKFIGHVLILAIATVLGYGLAGLAIQLILGNPDTSSWMAFMAMIGSSVLLGATFISIGYLVSTCVRDRNTAGGIAVGVWLLFVLIYDMALLGVLVADHGRLLTAERVNWLLLFNPADAFRLFNLTGTANVSMFAGMAGLSDDMATGRTTLLLVLVAWIVAPLALTTVLFSRKPV
jgi:Cu-processing system permease protein